MIRAVVWIFAASGCTALVGNAEIEGACETLEPDCALTRAAAGDRATCASFYCDLESQLCLRHPAEVCDGEDNDCDGWIDEGVLDVATPVSSTIASDVVAYAAGATLSVVLARSGTDEQRFVRVDAEGTPIPRALATTTNMLETSPDQDAPGCWSPGQSVPADCPASQLLLPSDGVGFALQVDPARARPAWQNDEELSIRGPDALSNAFRGLTHACGACSVRSAALLPLADAAIVAVNTGSTSRCSAGSIEIATVHAFGVTRTTLVASNDGLTQRVGPSFGDAAPALVAVPDVEGAILAYGDDQGRLVLAQLRPADRPIERDACAGSECTDDTWTSDPMPEAEILDVLDGAQPVGEIALSVSGNALAAVWMTGCAERDPRLVARRIVLEVSAGSVTNLRADAEVVIAERIGIPRNRLLDRALPFALAPLDAVAIDDVRHPGWLIVWIDGLGGARATRVSALDGAVIDPGARLWEEQMLQSVALFGDRVALEREDELVVGRLCSATMARRGAGP